MHYTKAEKVASHCNKTRIVYCKKKRHIIPGHIQGEFLLQISVARVARAVVTAQSVGEKNTIAQQSAKSHDLFNLNFLVLVEGFAFVGISHRNK